MNQPQADIPESGCDLERIHQFLQSNHYQLDDAELVSHLDTCESCRVYMENQAANADLWDAAMNLLQPNEFDTAGSVACSAAASNAISGSHPAMVQDALDSLSPSDDPHHLGRIGSYEVTGIVGVGAMGVVLKAIDPSLDRVVALKVMAPRLTNNEVARKRFLREAKAAAAVLHPNVIPIHSVSSDSRIPYLVMSYIRGGSLQKRLKNEGPLGLEAILRIGSQVAAGLEAAHEKGLVHRDIKPENVMLDEGVERVAITDFGLARAVDDNTVTQQGNIAGTPMYMSPEQARGEQVDQQSDLFSLGSVLYALSTGHPPFQADTSYGVMRRIIDEEPTPIRQLNPEMPDWFAQIVERLMAKEKPDRFSSAAEVHSLLDACLRHLQQPDAIPLPKDVRGKERPLCWTRHYAVRAILITISTAAVLLCISALLPNDDRPGGYSSKTRTPRENALIRMLKGASEDTEYASGYSEQRFQAIEIGVSVESVEAKIGRPLNTVPNKPNTTWLYAPEKHPGFAASGEYPTIDRACNVITFDDKGEFIRAYGQGGGKTKEVGDDALLVSGEFSFKRITPGPLGLSDELVAELRECEATMEDIRKRFGEPQAKHVSRVTKWLVYSRSPSSTHYRKRWIGIDRQGRVCEKKSEFYWD